MVRYVNTQWCYTDAMTDEVRKLTEAAIQRSGRSKAALARDVGVQRQYIGRMLYEGVGNASPHWVALLAELNLELTVQPKSGDK